MKLINYFRWLDFLSYGNHVGYYNRNSDLMPIDEFDNCAMCPDFELKRAMRIIDNADKQFAINIRQIKTKPKTLKGRFLLWAAKIVFR